MSRSTRSRTKRGSTFFMSLPGRSLTVCGRPTFGSARYSLLSGTRTGTRSRSRGRGPARSAAKGSGPDGRSSCGYRNTRRTGSADRSGREKNGSGNRRCSGRLRNCERLRWLRGRRSGGRRTSSGTANGNGVRTAAPTFSSTAHTSPSPSVAVRASRGGMGSRSRTGPPNYGCSGI